MMKSNYRKKNTPDSPSPPGRTSDRCAAGVPPPAQSPEPRGHLEAQPFMPAPGPGAGMLALSQGATHLPTLRRHPGLPLLTARPVLYPHTLTSAVRPHVQTGPIGLPAAPRHARVPHPGAPSSHTPVPSCSCPASSSVGCPEGRRCAVSLEPGAVQLNGVCAHSPHGFSCALPGLWPSSSLLQALRAATHCPDTGQGPLWRSPAADHPAGPLASHLTSGAGVCPHGLNFREGGHHL